MSMPWLRLYTETLSDRKIKMIAAELNLPKPLIIGVWTSLLMLAGESPERGRLVSNKGTALPDDFICSEIGLENGQFSKICREFVEFDMLFVDNDGIFVVTNWEQRQFKSDNSYERVKRYRRKQTKNGDDDTDDGEDNHNQYTKRNVSRNGNETFQETHQIQIQNQSLNTTIPPTDFQKACISWEENIGSLSQIISDNIRTYTAECPAGWVEKAIKEAAENNVRKWTYIKAILDSWLAAGQITDKPKKKPNGVNRNGRKQVATPADDEIAKRATAAFKARG